MTHRCAVLGACPAVGVDVRRVGPADPTTDWLADVGAQSRPVPTPPGLGDALARGEAPWAGELRDVAGPRDPDAVPPRAAWAVWT